MDITKQLENIRGVYKDAAFDLKDCDPNPLLQFDKWMEEAIKAKCDEPNAFTLSTVKDNEPFGRVVLLKGVLNEEFVFYTNYESNKGEEIRSNPNVALTFYWLPLHRQVRIKGIASFVEENISDDYFHKRPRGSQLGAIASPQSKKVESIKFLEESYRKAEEEFKDQTSIPRPKNWGGYKVKASSIEFWQGRDNRMHDRILYVLKNGKWELSRLAP